MTKYEDVIPPYKTYALPHGASTPSQAAFLSQKHNNEHQNSWIGSGKNDKRGDKRIKYGGVVIVPSFVEGTAPSSPVNANLQSKTINTTLLQGHANAEFDNMVNSKPKQLSVSEFRGGRRSSRRSRRLRRIRKSRRRGSSRGSPRRRLKRHKSMSKRKRHTKRRRRVYK